MICPDTLRGSAGHGWCSFVSPDSAGIEGQKSYSTVPRSVETDSSSVHWDLLRTSPFLLHFLNTAMAESIGILADRIEGGESVRDDAVAVCSRSMRLLSSR